MNSIHDFSCEKQQLSISKQPQTMAEGNDYDLSSL